MRAVHVIWIDSHTEIGWDAYRAEHTEPDLTHTVGVMIDETENYAILTTAMTQLQTNGTEESQSRSKR